MALPGGCNSVSASGITYYNCGDAAISRTSEATACYTVVANPF